MFFYSMENAAKESALGLPRYASTKSDKVIRFGRQQRGIPEGAAIKLLPVKDISPNPSQPRRFFEAEAIASLADSIRQYGIIQPLTVRHLIHGDKYELIAGDYAFIYRKVFHNNSFLYSSFVVRFFCPR